MEEYIVYKHTAPNGKVYIGITRRRPEVRWGKNGLNYKKNKHFYNAIKKYGWDAITHEILLEGLSEEQACEYEKMYIALFDSANSAKGYNNTYGGEHGRMADHVNEENRKRGKLLTGSKNPFYGHRHSEDSKLKMRQARLGNPKRCDHSRAGGLAAAKTISKKVSQYDLDGNYIATYNSLVDAAKAVGGHGNKIGACCNGYENRKKAYGYIWKWKQVVHEDSKLTE